MGWELSFSIPLRTIGIGLMGGTAVASVIWIVFWLVGRRAAKLEEPIIAGRGGRRRTDRPAPLERRLYDRKPIVTLGELLAFVELTEKSQRDPSSTRTASW
jgi:hypothetical protein